jgi:hypothetical protein
MIKLILLVCIMTSQFAVATDGLSGMIVRQNNGRFATDLIHKGEVADIDELQDLHNSGFEISKLDPEKSQIWDGKKKNSQLKKDNLINIAETDLKYISKLETSFGSYRMNVVDNNSPYNSTYTVMFGKTIHNILLRKNLLRKLGYIVPGIQYIPEISIRFRNSLEKSVMIEDLKAQTMALPKRWVVDEQKKVIRVQDVIIMNNNESIYNLALGKMLDSIVKERRVLSSLLVSYSLVNAPESINLFSWITGRILSENVHLDYPSAGEYKTTWEDARWITKKILKLRAIDFREIVEKSYYPDEVAALLIEKLKSRRNSLIRVFSVDENDKFIARHNNLKINPTISMGEHLHLGELRLENWPGYVSRFSYGDPESPMNGKEMFGFFKSRALSYAIDNAISFLNSQRFMGTDIQSRILAHNNQNYLDQLLELITTGQISPTPFQVYAVPYAAGNLILSRSVVAGSYMGTDNKIQLADTIGFAVSAGAYLGSDGVPTPFLLRGNAMATYYRTYSHIKPISSISKAMKYKFKNIIVPLLKLNNGKVLKSISEIDPDVEVTTEQREALEEQLKLFNDKLKVGESIIITDHLGGSLGIDAGAQLFSIGQNLPAVAAYLKFSSSAKIISRVHILKRADNIIQIYRDLGNIKSIGLSTVLEAAIPVIKLNFKTSNGRARMKFHQINLDARYNNVKSLISKSIALRNAFIKGNYKKVDEVAKPYIFRYKFAEKKFGFTLPIFRTKKANNDNSIEIEHPTGEKLEAYRRVKYSTRGIDYENFISSMANIPLSLVKQIQLSLPTNTDINPGNTFLGKAKNKITEFEGLIDQHGRITRPYSKLSYVWNGWRIKKKSLLRKIKKIHKKYNFEFFPELLFNETKSVILYNLKLEIGIHKEAIEQIMFKGYSFAKNAYIKYCNKRKCRKMGSKRFAQKFVNLKHEFVTQFQNKDHKKYSNTFMKIFELIEKKLKVQGLLSFAGGDENVFITSRLDGFRNGDENGDKAVISHTIGQIGRRSPRGVLSPLMNKIGVAEGEAFINWLINRPY